MLLSFQESCQEIWGWLQKYAGSSPWMLLLSIAACLYLLISSRTFRQNLLLPIILLIAIVINPLLYSLVYNNHNLPFVAGYGLRYWRFFWMLPQGLLIGLAVSDLMGRLSNSLLRCMSLILVAGIIILTCQNMFMDKKQFRPAASVYKINASVQKACEMILEDNPQPLCLFDNHFSAQAREYDGSIRQVWGRGGTWNVVSDPEALEAHHQLRAKPRNWEYVFEFAEQRGVTHIASIRRKGEDKKELLAMAERHGYTVMHKTGRTIIFRSTR